jgi:hypothetical protein
MCQFLVVCKKNGTTLDDTRLQDALDELLRLYARIDTRLAALEANVAEIKGTMVTKKNLAEVTQAITRYGKQVEGMLNAFEKRISPQAA